MRQSGTLAAVGIPTPPYHLVLGTQSKPPGRDPLTNRIIGVEDPNSADSNNHVRHDFAFEFYTLLQKIQNLKQAAATHYFKYLTKTFTKKNCPLDHGDIFSKVAEIYYSKKNK